MARNIVERIFGVLKCRFCILLLLPEYNLMVQACIPSALCAIHNFIRHHDPGEGDLPQIPLLMDSQNDFLPYAPPGITNDAAETAGAWTMRDNIAQAMWDDYQAILADADSEGDNNSIDFSSEDLNEIDKSDFQ